MIEQFGSEVGEWMQLAYNLGILGVRCGDSAADLQRSRLSYCIAKEILVQCKEIENTSYELMKNMRNIAEFVDDSENSPKAKTLKR